MRHAWFLVVMAICAVAIFGAGQAAAAPGSETQVLGSADPLVVDPLQEQLELDVLAASTATQQYGPIPSSSLDSGTCGNSWATDQFNRYFMVKANKDGTFRVVEQFKDGTFETLTGPSPGACDADDGTPPGAVTTCCAGTMHGYILITANCGISPFCPNPFATCAGGPASPCQTTAGFLAEFFPGATFTYDAFFFHYTGNAVFNNILTYNSWKNASPNRGCNHGDIAVLSAPAPSPPLNLCP